MPLAEMTASNSLHPIRGTVKSGDGLVGKGGLLLLLRHMNIVLLAIDSLRHSLGYEWVELGEKLTARRSEGRVP